MFKKIIAIFIFCIAFQFGFSIEAKVAAIQITAKQQSFHELEEIITQYATDAKNQGANIVVFPEDDKLNLIYDKPWNKDSLIELSKSYDDIKSFVSKLAKNLDIYIVAGSTTRVEDGKLYNTALVAIPSGYVIEHNKIYLTPSEKKVGYDGSGNTILIIDTDYGRIAILICYTSEFPNVSYALTQAQPDIIIVPSYSDDIYGLNRVHTATKMLSIQNYAYGVVVGMVSNRGMDNLDGADGVAQALFTSPQQKEFPIGEFGKAKFNHEDMVIETLDIDKLHSAREEYTAYPNKDAQDSNKNLYIKTIGFK